MNVAAIVLAAGASTRMGRPKQLLPFGGSTILGSVLDALLAARLDGITVVLGHGAAEVRASLADRPVSFILNPQPERGMLSSIQCGLSARPDADAYLIVLGDQPLLRTEVVDALIAAAGSSTRSLFLPTYAGRRGHPLLVRADYRQAILDLPDTVGLNSVVQSHGEDVEEVPTDSREVLDDVDTPEDYERLRG